MEPITIDQMRTLYPDQWLLVGNPELSEPEINGSIVSKLLRGVVLIAGKDKREVAFLSKGLQAEVESTACIYTGEIPQNRAFLL